MIELAVVGGSAYGFADLVFSWNPLAAAPYLAHRHAPVFRDPPAYLLGFFAEAANGWIVTLALLFVRPALRGSVWRAGAAFGAMIWGFWVVSGTASAMVWLDVPWSVGAANVAFGLPKAIAIATAVVAYERWRPATAAAGASPSESG